MQLPQPQLQSLSVFFTKLLLTGFALQMLVMLPMAATASAQQLSASPSDLRFGAVTLGQSETLLLTVTNTGPSSVEIDGISSDQPMFAPPTLPSALIVASGQSFNVNVTFTPTAVGWTGDMLHFLSGSTSVFDLHAGGSGSVDPALGASPSVLSFGQVAVGKSVTLPVVITNSRGWDVTVTAMQSTNGEFSLSGASLPLTLSHGQSTTVNVTFTPQAAGPVGSSLYIYPALVVPMTGTGSAVGQLVLAPAPLNFGSVTVGKTGTQSLTLSATGGSVTVSSAASGNPQFVLEGASFPFTIAAGQSQSFNVAFTPASSGAQSSSLIFASNASNSQASESLSGTGAAATVLGQLVLSPTPLSFGSVTVGQTSTQPLTLSAMGGNVTVTSASSGSSEFVLGGASFPFTIAAGQSQSFSVAFTPTNSGAQSSSLIFASNASNSQAAESVSGTGTLAVGQLVLAPTPLSFGNVTVGQTGTQSLTLSATGGSVTVSSAASGNAQFVLEGASFPFTIASGQSQSFNVAFTPTASGAQSSSLSFTSNASNSQASESLSGTGMAASYSVNLYWNASSDATGYNVYRSASASGSYAKINSSLTPSTSFTDSSVTSGQTYYYAATSVNSEGAESARSAAVQAVIP